MNLFTSKLRRTATMVGGAAAGLGVILAMATPALACDTKISADSSCFTDKGWTATWSVQNDFNTIATIESVKLDGVEVPGGVGDIKVNATVQPDYNQTVSGTSSFTTDGSHNLSVTMQWPGQGRNSHNDLSDESNTTASPKTHGCDSKPSTPPTTPPTTPATTPPTASPSPSETPTIPLPTESSPALPGEIYSADCSSVTIGLDNTKTPIEFKLTLTPTTGATQVLDIKPGEKKSAKFAASGDDFSVKLSIVGIYKGVTSPAQTATIPWTKPASCSSGALPVTGSSAAPLAGGALAVVLVGGGLFFMTRRRKTKFTA